MDAVTSLHYHQVVADVHRSNLLLRTAQLNRAQVGESAAERLDLRLARFAVIAWEHVKRANRRSSRRRHPPRVPGPLANEDPTFCVLLFATAAVKRPFDARRGA